MQSRPSQDRFSGVGIQYRINKIHHPKGSYDHSALTPQEEPCPVKPQLPSEQADSYRIRFGNRDGQLVGLRVFVLSGTYEICRGRCPGARP